ncbi:hypothetical protein F442_22978 [Phytophthora nicotianae P10297]|uniref:Uncharacterized protein n=1 Tax=Phytophthora nicotianae P10297 TaxID=1317064 RepID=W2XZ40_PHYNI|nr:hypothetical protein F442_22978 [Phytophthora nicotianae P10297]
MVHLDHHHGKVKDHSHVVAHYVIAAAGAAVARNGSVYRHATAVVAENGNDWVALHATAVVAEVRNGLVDHETASMNVNPISVATDRVSMVPTAEYQSVHEVAICHAILASEVANDCGHDCTVFDVVAIVHASRVLADVLADKNSAASDSRSSD